MLFLRFGNHDDPERTHFCLERRKWQELKSWSEILEETSALIAKIDSTDSIPEAEMFPCESQDIVACESSTKKDEMHVLNVSSPYRWIAWEEIFLCKEILQ